MYELYIGNKNYSSWSLRPWVLMKTLGVPFTERQVRFEGVSNWDRFRAFAPNGRVPCLRDGERIVWDSLAIAEYLAERHAGFWPADDAARAWARSATAEMHSGFPALRTHCSMSVGVRVRLREWPDALRADVARVDEIWDDGLRRFGGPFLAGDRFTIVDAFYCPVAYRARTYSVPLGNVAQHYANRLLALPAMREWEAAALAEPWRDTAHDLEITGFGDVIADLRAPADA
jgi:glutathione S-transferase